MKATSPKFTLEVIDCIEGMRKLPESSVDVVVTSPPYNLGIKYHELQGHPEPPGLPRLVMQVGEGSEKGAYE